MDPQESAKEYTYRERYSAPPRTSCLKSIKYIVDVDTGCWVCTSHARSSRGGYPVVTRNGKLYRMSRYIFEQENGSIDETKFILHSCDNPLCINPEHLSEGTPKENTADMIRKGRKPLGTAVPCAKLTCSDVLSIRKDTRSLLAIAKAYGVSKKAVLNVKKYKTWKHVIKEDIS